MWHVGNWVLGTLLKESEIYLETLFQLHRLGLLSDTNRRMHLEDKNGIYMPVRVKFK